MKRIAILGSTGSIGQNTLKIIRRFSGQFRVTALSTNANIDILAGQIRLFRPKSVYVHNSDAVARIKTRTGLAATRVLTGREGLAELIRDKAIDKIVLAISGSAALMPLLEAIEAGKDIALANKEALVMAGRLIMEKATRKKVEIIPIDSEHSAIWQCLEGEDKGRLKNIYLTASGGPLRRTPGRYFKNISVRRVLRHPRWKMGTKITVDSATLMNKGLELLEAMYLFNVGPDKIKIIIHPEAIVHSMVEFIDGSVIAQLSVTDMRIPIQYALTYPHRYPGSIAGIDFCRLNKLTFEKPDFAKFPCLGFAYRAAKEEGTLPAVLNAADEISVEAFLKGRIRFISIPRVIDRVLEKHRNKKNPDLKAILEADEWARRESANIINRIN